MIMQVSEVYMNEVWHARSGIVVRECARGRIRSRAAPAGAHVVKALNTLFGHVLAANQAQGRPPDVFIAGDDAGAKARVSAFTESLALRPLDAGDLKMAH
jgi:predicted dinucleotide-binding enzyme